MARPRFQLPEQEITAAFKAGTPMTHLAAAHGVDRGVIRRIVTEADNVLAFPDRIGRVLPPGHVASIELIQRAGISYRQLDHWTRLGLVHAIPRTKDDSGYPREYTADQAARTCLVARLVHAGIAPRIAAEHASQLLEIGTTTIAGLTVYLPEEL